MLKSGGGFHFWLLLRITTLIVFLYLLSLWLPHLNEMESVIEYSVFSVFTITLLVTFLGLLGDLGEYRPIEVVQDERDIQREVNKLDKIIQRIHRLIK